MFSLDIWIVLGILVGAIVLFVTEWLSVDLVALGVVLGLMLFGILSPDAALAGFSSPIVITVAALFIVGGAVMETGLADIISSKIGRKKQFQAAGFDHGHSCPAVRLYQRHWNCGSHGTCHYQYQSEEEYQSLQAVNPSLIWIPARWCDDINWYPSQHCGQRLAN